MRFKVKDQVAYIPAHADRDINHRDVEFGFVGSIRGDTIFVRYWRKGHEGSHLRTIANAEATPEDMLVPVQRCTPAEVERAYRGVYDDNGNPI